MMKEMLARYDNYALSVSMTTRNPRPDELDGVSYFFVDKDTFEETIAQDGLVEYANYCGYYYGTPRKWVEQKLAEGKDVILEIEIQGALKIKQRFPDALLIFVMTPSAAELERRLRGRGTESEDVIAGRMRRAIEESEGIENYDYIVINDKLDECAARMHEIILAEHMRPYRQINFIDQFREELKALVKGEE